MQQNIYYRVFIKNCVFSKFTATHPLHVEEQIYPRKRSECTLTITGPSFYFVQPIAVQSWRRRGRQILNSWKKTLFDEHLVLVVCLKESWNIWWGLLDRFSVGFSVFNQWLNLTFYFSNDQILILSWIHKVQLSKMSKQSLYDNPFVQGRSPRPWIEQVRARRESSSGKHHQDWTIHLYLLNFLGAQASPMG